MIRKSDQLAAMLKAEPEKQKDRLLIRPMPDLKALEDSGAASVDLRLGTWFVTLRHTRFAALDIDESQTTAAHNAALSRSQYIPFGKEFFLQPGGFVLGVTLEWVKLPSTMAGYVVGKSSWGRRGLIIATAAGVHPGFAGCLTLEISNVGEIPIGIKPGLPICQLFLHSTDTTDAVDKSLFVGRRKPVLGKIELDDVAKKLAKGQRP